MRKKLIVTVLTAVLLTALPLSEAGQSFTAYAGTSQTSGADDTMIAAAAKTDKAVVTVSKARLKKFQKGTKKTLKLSTEMGSVTLDRKLAKSLLNKAKGKKIDVIMEKVELSEEQKQLFGAEAAAWKISFRSAGKTILNPNSTGAFAVFYPDQELSGKGAEEISLCRLITGGKVYRNAFSFTEEQTGDETRLSCRVKGNLQGTFIIGEKTDIETAWLISGVRSTTIKAKVTAAEKAQPDHLSYVSLNWTKSKGFKLDGYEIFHSFNGISYQKAHTLEGTECYNHNVASGTTKYYKIRGFRTIDGRVYYTRWSNVVSGTV